MRFEGGPAGPGVLGTMRQNDPVFGKTFDHAEVARVMGVPMEALDASLPVQGGVDGDDVLRGAVRFGRGDAGAGGEPGGGGPVAEGAGDAMVFLRGAR